MHATVITFPGSNCDRDVAEALRKTTGANVSRVWHTETTLPQTDLIVLPGGFSWGDYLRCGAMAARAPIMDDVCAHAARGVRVLGICNGFQILCESGLLPGALVRNEAMTFVCKDVGLNVGSSQSDFTHAYFKQRQGGEPIIRLPIAHGEGNYRADDETLRRIEGEGQVAFRYAEESPNGSLNAIAGIVNAQGTILGMMPHPERAVEAIHSSTDGVGVFESVLARIEGRRV